MNRRDSYSNRMACTLRGSDAIAGATDAARAFGEAQGLSDRELARLCIVIEELVANLYDHGGLTGSDEVDLSFFGEPRCIRITLVDPGSPFDPRSEPPGGEIPQRGGGAGIEIVRAWAQITGYAVTAEGNRLEFLLPLR